MKKEFYGNLSIVINMNFTGLEANSIEEAEAMVMDSEFEFKLLNSKTGEEIDIDIQGWHIADEVGRGNVTESDLRDFQIDEEI